jgi:meiotic recombination protein SPO11
MFVIAKIESIFSSFADCLLQDKGKLVIPFKIRPRGPLNTVNLDPKVSQETKMRDISFPGSSPQEAWRFSDKIPGNFSLQN